MLKTPLSTAKDDSADIDNNEGRFYVKKNTGFTYEIDDCEITPFIYQPTPLGIIELCKHYAHKYSIDLQSVDLSGQIESGADLRCFFTYIQQHPELTDVSEGASRGLILSHGQHHAVPLLICNVAGTRHMIVFDSTSGSRIQGYFKIADYFPDAQFYLNAGTRQVDEGSCITDALCVLKEALQLRNLMQLIHCKLITEHPSLVNFKPAREASIGYVNRFFQVPPRHFHLFKMPEQLLLTAQSSKYLVEATADLDVIVRGGNSLRYYRNNYRMRVSLAKNERTSMTEINSYLYLKSKEHKKIIDLRQNPEEANHLGIGLGAVQNSRLKGQQPLADSLSADDLDHDNMQLNVPSPLFSPIYSPFEESSFIGRSTFSR